MSEQPVKRRVGSKKVWLALIGNFSIIGLALSGTGDASAYGAIGLITATAIGAIGAGDFKKIGSPPP